MAITQLGLHGPQAAYGTFSPKAFGDTPAPTITRYGLTGAMAAYATFLPKSDGSGGGTAGAFYIFGDTVIS